MKPPKHRNQIGRLEIFFSAAALLLTIGSIVGPWTFNPLIALVLLAIVYGILRDLRALKGLKETRANATHSEEITCETNGSRVSLNYTNC